MTGRLLSLGLAALVFHLLLIQPNHPNALTWQALLFFPLELPVILLTLAALPPGRWAGAARVVLVAVLMAAVVLKIADFALFSAFGRSFNPVADLALIPAGVRLSISTMGAVPTIAALLAALAALCGVAAAAWWASSVWARVRLPGAWRTGAALTACLCAVAVVADTVG